MPAIHLGYLTTDIHLVHMPSQFTRIRYCKLQLCHHDAVILITPLPQFRLTPQLSVMPPLNIHHHRIADHLLMLMQVFPYTFSIHSAHVHPKDHQIHMVMNRLQSRTLSTFHQQTRRIQQFGTAWFTSTIIAQFNVAKRKITTVTKDEDVVHKKMTLCQRHHLPATRR
jgi:hypothetical protein